MTENLLENNLPEKFKDPKTGELRTDVLAKSYTELEKKLSSVPAVPKSPEDYNVDCSHGLFAPDVDINKALHEKGFSQDQVQFVYDLAAETMVPMIIDMSADYQADRELEKLVDQFGGEEKWKEMSRQLLAFGQKNLPEDVLDTLASSHEGVMALFRMMKGEEPPISTDANTAAPNDGELQLQSMVRDPKYWRDQDPSFIKKVSEGFQKVYGN